MNSAERERVLIHAGLMGELVRGHKKSLRHGATIMPLPDESLGTTWIIADWGPDPGVTAVLWGAAIYAPPVAVTEDVKDEMLAFVASFRPGKITPPTKETDMKRQMGTADRDSVREEVK